jgi:hypothetical protein
MTRLMCAKLGAGVQLSAPYAQHMLGKAERPWRTLRDNASAMLHNMHVPTSMWPCIVNTFVYLRNRTCNRAVGLSGGVPITLLTYQAPDASKFRVFGCMLFVKISDKLRDAASLMASGTWKLVDLPPDRVVASIMWIYKDQIRHKG